jgi:hypothetical protein
MFRLAILFIKNEGIDEGATPPHAIRVSLGAPGSRADLVRGLEVLASALKSSAVATQMV